MELPQRLRLVDDRWRRLVAGSMTLLLSTPAEVGREVAFALRSEPDFVKAKWVPGAMPAAKVYQSLNIVPLGLRG